MNLEKLFPQGVMNDFGDHYMVTGATGYLHAVAVKRGGEWELTELGEGLQVKDVAPAEVKVEVKAEPVTPKKVKPGKQPKADDLDDLDF